MPHSSGGGSAGGGFHGGSGGGSSIRTSTSYFAGATRYIYYCNGVPNEIFSNTDIKKNAAATKLALTLFVAIFMGLFALIFITSSFHYPKKMKMDYDTAIVISDHAGIMTEDEEKKLMDSLIFFQDETGITPAVYTVNNEDWDDHDDLEKYAYDLYVSRFEDEQHWLIIYSEPRNPNTFKKDWYWEGMQGNDTDGILGSSETEMFGKELTSLIEENKDIRVADAIAKSFDDSTPEIMRQYTKWGFLIAGCAIAVLAVAGVVVIQIFGGKEEKKYETAIKVDKDELLKKQKCNYCGGVYIEGHHTTCPHCGAQLPFYEPVFEPGESDNSDS